MKAKFYYDMARFEIRDKKLKEIKRQGGASPVDYEELTVTDEDFQEEERLRFSEFLKKRKEDKEHDT